MAATTKELIEYVCADYNAYFENRDCPDRCKITNVIYANEDATYNFFFDKTHYDQHKYINIKPIMRIYLILDIYMNKEDKNSKLYDLAYHYSNSILKIHNNLINFVSIIKDLMSFIQNPSVQNDKFFGEIKDLLNEKLYMLYRTTYHILVKCSKYINTNLENKKLFIDAFFKLYIPGFDNGPFQTFLGNNRHILNNFIKYNNNDIYFINNKTLLKIDNKTIERLNKNGYAKYFYVSPDTTRLLQIPIGNHGDISDQEYDKMTINF